LRAFDSLIHKSINAALEKQGVSLRRNTDLLRVAGARGEGSGVGWGRLLDRRGGVEVTVKSMEEGEYTKSYDEVIYAIGRTPMVSGLGIENLGGGVTVTGKGHIATDELQNTGVQGVHTHTRTHTHTHTHTHTPKHIHTQVLRGSMPSGMSVGTGS
jgi:glutathione reductase (NADPH)